MAKGNAIAASWNQKIKTPNHFTCEKSFILACGEKEVSVLIRMVDRHNEFLSECEIHDLMLKLKPDQYFNT